MRGARWLSPTLALAVAASVGGAPRAGWGAAPSASPSASASTGAGAPAGAPSAAPPAASSGGAAGGAAAPTAASVADASAAVEHFRAGVRLYQDRNFDGALAEFEEAQRLRPGPGALQNIALCQRALFRYVEATRTLRRLLADHGAGLDGAQRQRVDVAIAELASLIGSLRLRVTPEDAVVTLDGRALGVEERRAPLEVDVGEHELAAEAPGHAPLQLRVRVAGGRRDVPVELALRPTQGFLHVRAHDPRAAIAVDGVPRARGEWRGAVDPGRHVVQVYRSGFASAERSVAVELGREQAVDLRLGPPTDEPDEPAPSPGTTRGFFALVGLGVNGLSPAPAGLRHADGREGAIGTELELRSGYRLWSPVGLEAALELGDYGVDACLDEECLGRQRYELTTLRVGAHLRLFSAGRRLRFTSAVGMGAVRQALEVRPSTAADALAPSRAAGVNGWFGLELGGQLSLGAWLIEALVVTQFDAAQDLRAGDYRPYEAGGVQTLGVSLRGGWAEWE